MEDHVTEHVPTYERPDVKDYGTLVDVTRAGTSPNADVPNGNNNTAYSAAP